MKRYEDTEWACTVRTVRGATGKFASVILWREQPVNQLPRWREIGDMNRAGVPIEVRRWLKTQEVAK